MLKREKMYFCRPVNSLELVVKNTGGYSFLTNHHVGGSCLDQRQLRYSYVEMMW